MDVATLIAMTQKRTDDLFTDYLKNLPAPAPQLHAAIAYAVCNGGKRIRPLLVYATGMALRIPLATLDPAALAIELMHTYSLIHDDLPAMDNADLRRGKPSCHKVYGEATAILAGDALQALAFEVIAAHPAQLTAAQRVRLLTVLAQAVGWHGMAGGQALDMQNKTLSLPALLELYRLKTGALLLASVKMGLACATESDPHTQEKLENYAACIGLGFQLRDDLLDIETSTAVSGKPQNLDAANQKCTYPLLVGKQKTREKIVELHEEALRNIAFLADAGAGLRAISHYLLARSY